MKALGEKGKPHQYERIWANLWKEAAHQKRHHAQVLPFLKGMEKKKKQITLDRLGDYSPK